ncbi:hypothetical protein [Rarobacter faecitabidus]|uniref:hypothetical protein n=1 Tax=Rarobacter faecitabidus TaxID=13243 RepID=UPI00114EAA03|nr:hypothetical protein [Rarobacter faecitabidus]
MIGVDQRLDALRVLRVTAASSEQVCAEVLLMLNESGLPLGSVAVDLVRGACEQAAHAAQMFLDLVDVDTDDRLDTDRHAAADVDVDKRVGGLDGNPVTFVETHRVEDSGFEFLNIGVERQMPPVHADGKSDARHDASPSVGHSPLSRSGVVGGAGVGPSAPVVPTVGEPSDAAAVPPPAAASEHSRDTGFSYHCGSEIGDALLAAVERVSAHLETIQRMNAGITFPNTKTTDQRPVLADDADRS